MGVWKKVALGTVLLILIGAWYYWYTVPLFGDCGTDEVTRSRSPDSRYDAVVYTLNCGATTGWATSVAILSPSEAVPRQGGNVANFDGMVKVQLRWPAADSLTLTYDKHEKLFDRAGKVHSVRIVYRPLNSDGL
jgi:hypothetical protein